ncbi:hypothetical protein D3C72_2036970 [compost metagenome]
MAMVLLGRVLVKGICWSFRHLMLGKNLPVQGLADCVDQLIERVAEEAINVAVGVHR